MSTVKNIKLGNPFQWNGSWYVSVKSEDGDSFELKFRQKDAPKKVDILEVYEQVSASVEPVIDRGLILVELKATIMENDIKPLELFEKNVISMVVE